MRYKLLIALFFFSQVPFSWAKTGLPLPRYVSLRSNKINVRVGPGRHYPIEWVYVRSNFPVEITAEYENWRKIRDHEGAEGWVHQSMLSGQRYAFVTKDKSELRSQSHETARPVAILSQGVTGKLLKCQGQWCKVQMAEHQGWLDKKNFFGAYEHETVN